MNQILKEKSPKVTKESVLDIIIKVFSPLSTILVAWSYVPQILMTYKTQNVAGQSLSFWIILSVALGMITLVQLALVVKSRDKSYGALYFQSINFILAVVMLIGVVVFK